MALIIELIIIFNQVATAALSAAVAYLIYLPQRINKEYKKYKTPAPRTDSTLLIIDFSDIAHNQILSLMERTNETERIAIIKKSLQYYETLVSCSELGGRIIIEAPDKEIQELEIK